MNSDSSTALRRKLEALVIESAEFKALEQSRLGFCPFEAMGVVDAEIRHSNFLASFMDPYRSHGLGTRFLREVLDGIVGEVGQVGGISRLTLHLLDLELVDIRREWNHIDLLIVFPDAHLVVAFELKIRATESKGQLRGYRQAIERQWPSAGDERWTHLLLFLTRDRQLPCDEGWHAVTYDIIIQAITRVLHPSVAGEPVARSMLGAYAAMLRKHHMNDPELAEQARALWQRHREALDYLMAQRPDGLVSVGPIAMERVREIAERSSTASIHIEPDDSSTKSYTRFFVREWEELPGIKSGSGWIPSNRMLIIEMQFWPNLIKAALILGPGPTDVRTRLFDAAQPGISRAAKKLSEKWKTLASTQLVTAAQLEDGHDAVVETLIDGLRQFVEGTIVKFDELFRPKRE